MEAVVALVGGIIFMVVLLRAFRSADATARRLEDEAAEWTMPIAEERGSPLPWVEHNQDDPSGTTQPEFPKSTRFGRVHPILNGMRFPQIRIGPRGGRYTEATTKDGKPYRRYF